MLRNAPTASIETMLYIDRVLQTYGGLISARELTLFRWDKTMIDLFVSYGVIERVRRGWYAAPFLEPEVRRAATIGGRLGCVSALAFLDGRPQPHGPLHVAVNRNAKRLRCPDDPRLPLDTTRDGIVLHWLADLGGLDDDRVVTEDEARRQARHCRALPPSVARAVLESSRRP